MLDEAYREAEKRIEQARIDRSTELDLSNLGLTELPEAIGQLVDLKVLYLGYEYGKKGDRNKLTTLPDCLGNLSQLQQLHLDDNQLTTLPECLGNLSQLLILSLNNNQLTTVPESLGNLSQLQRLNLDKNQLTTLPDCLGNLSQLKKLDIRENQLTTLPDCLGNLSQLQVLFLGGNQLTTLPDCLGNLSQLQGLFLSRNQLTTLPDCLGNLSQLQQLDLDHNQLTTLPDCLGNLSQLQVLFLDSNQLTTLPECLGNLSQLKKLHLYFNQLTTIPEFLGNLSQLQQLELGKNQLTTIPEFLGNLSQLQRLCISVNQLKKIPKSSGNISQLQQLYLRGNKLTTIPKSFGNLSQLQQLDLRGNQLTTLPDCLGNLSQLQGLELSKNQLTTLPECLGNLSQLQELHLYFNQLTTIPECLGNLSQLQLLDLRENPLNPEIAATYQQGINTLKTYLKARAEGEIALNEAKLILVGEGEVGKSCLLGALRGDHWVEGRPTTHGIEIKPVSVTDPNRNTEITLNGWDFGGQRVYRPTHQLFFSPSAVYLVVWKPREGPQQGFVKEWITLIKHREPDAKILVVATHGGPTQRQPDIDRQELIDLFGEETVLGFFFVDSKPDSETGECRGIEELRQKITEVAIALPGMGRTIPAKWHQVRQALSATGQPYLSYDDAIAICTEQGVEEFLAELCIRVYHTLGNIVHYYYDPLLKDIVILKPDWLAKAISFVLDDEMTRRRNGLVEFEHLSQIWSHPQFENESGYPEELHPIFLRLMERFDLSYKVVLDAQSKEESTTSLIAQLVRDNRPEQELLQVWGREVPAGERQQIQICRIVDQRGQLATAEGLFYQLIVRLHKYSLGREDYHNSVHWQRGLVLDDDYNGRALLEHIDTNIRITVRAAYPEFFLHQLTREVQWLVESFWEGLRCEVVVPCIEPCGKNQPGLGQFEVQKLIESKKKNRPEYPCNVSGCDEWQNIDELMRNATFTPSTPQVTPSNQLSEILNELKQVRQDIRVLDSRDHKRYQNLSQGQKKILSQVDQEFDTLMQMFTDEAKEGPRLFSFKPLEPGFFDRPQWMSAKFQLTLWCEHSRQPLPQLNPDNPKAGVYELTLSREWLTKAAPYLKFMTTTIGLVLPVAGAATKMILDDNAYKNIEEELSLAEKSIEFSIKGSDISMDWFEKNDAPDLEYNQQYGGSILAQGSMLRQLHSILKEKDPNFGGLERVQDKQRKFLWVHPQFINEY